MNNDLSMALSSKLDKNLNLVGYTASSENKVNASYGGAFFDSQKADYKLNTHYIGDKITDSTMGKQMSVWHWWEDYYYPRVIRESYPVYVQERSLDKGKQAFELIKMMKDKGFVKLDKASDFIELMDALIRTL